VRFRIGEFALVHLDWRAQPLAPLDDLDRVAELIRQGHRLPSLETSKAILEVWPGRKPSPTMP
jgi:hypothetical protein